MNILFYALVLVAALRAKAGSFSVYLGKKKYTVDITSADHTAPLGKFSFAQAAAIAAKVASGNISFTIRIADTDYTVAVTVA